MPRTRSVTAGYVILGLVTLGALYSIFRARRRSGPSPRSLVFTVVISRVLSALLGIPAFFADIPGAIKVVVAVSIALTILGLALVRPELAEPSPGGAAATPA